MRPQLCATIRMPDPPPLPRALQPCSFMERAVGAGVHAHLLTEQYRMHPSICSAISNEFYGGLLRTAAVTAARRALLAPCRVVNVKGWEKHHDKAGYSNMKEAKRWAGGVHECSAKHQPPSHGHRQQQPARANTHAAFLCCTWCRAVKEAAAAAEELRSLGIQQPSIYLSLYNRQRDLITKLVDSSADGARLRAASDCQMRMPASPCGCLSCPCMLGWCIVRGDAVLSARLCIVRGNAQLSTRQCCPHTRLQVLSVDACQGDEADAVIVSTVKSTSHLSK